MGEGFSFSEKQMTAPERIILGAKENNWRVLERILSGAIDRITTHEIGG